MAASRVALQALTSSRCSANGLGAVGKTHARELLRKHEQASSEGVVAASALPPHSPHACMWGPRRTRNCRAAAQLAVQAAFLAWKLWAPLAWLVKLRDALHEADAVRPHLWRQLARPRGVLSLTDPGS